MLMTGEPVYNSGKGVSARLTCFIVEEDAVWELGAYVATIGFVLLALLRREASLSLNDHAHYHETTA